MIPLFLSPSRHAALVAGLAERMAAVAGSQHFTVYQLEPAAHTPEAGPEVVVVHSFSPAQIDNNLGYYVANELLPLLAAAGRRSRKNGATLGPFAYSEQDLFEHSVGAIVRSVDGNERRAWHRFYANSLAALEQAMAAPEGVPDFIWPFGVIYQHVINLLRGSSLLDAGTCFGFLPLLLARRTQRAGTAAGGGSGRLDTIVGCDLSAALVGFAQAFAAQEQLAAQFVTADLLADDFGRLGRFDSVTCIHVIEHLDAEQTDQALANLWRITRQRLIIAVPLEETPDPRFGHRQVFNEARLLALGRRLEGRAQYLERHGGWLIVDRGD